MGGAAWVWSQEGVVWEQRRRLSLELVTGVEQAGPHSLKDVAGRYNPRVEVGQTPRLGLGSPKAAWPGNPRLEGDVGVASGGLGLGILCFGQDWL